MKIVREMVHVKADEIDDPVWYPTAGPREPLDRVA